MTKMNFSALAILSLSGALMAASCKSPEQNSTVNEPSAEDIVYIPDSKFLKFLIEGAKADTNKDGQISYGEAWAVTQLVDTEDSYPIDDLTGLEAFKNLTAISFSEFNLGDQKYSFAKTDLRSMPNLQYLMVGGEEMATLVLGAKPKLTELRLFAAKMKELDLREAPNIKTLYINSQWMAGFTAIYVHNGFKLPETWDIPNGVTIAPQK